MLWIKKQRFCENSKVDSYEVLKLQIKFLSHGPLTCITVNVSPSLPSLLYTMDLVGLDSSLIGPEECTKTENTVEQIL